MNPQEITCRLIKDDQMLISDSKGVKPLLDWIGEGLIENGYVIDKIIGRASALLLVYGKARMVHGITMSKGADEELTRFGIPHSYENLIEKVINRRGDDICPMDKTVLEITDPKQAYLALRNKVYQDR